MVYTCLCVTFNILTTVNSRCDDIIYGERFPYSVNGVIVNPRCACAARVTVLALCVCVSVCVSPLILALQAANRLMSNTNGSSTTSARKIMWRFR